MKFREIQEACWRGYQQQGMKKKGNRMVPNCVAVSEVKTGPEMTLNDLLYTAAAKAMHQAGLEGVSMDYEEAIKKAAKIYRIPYTPSELPRLLAQRAEIDRKLAMMKQGKQVAKARRREKLAPTPAGAEEYWKTHALPTDRIKPPTRTLEETEAELAEDLRKWFKEKWVRFGPDGKIRGSCARGSEKEGKPKCLPQSKAHALGKKGRASAAAKKRREDPNPERRGAAKNVATKVSEMDKTQKSQERHGDYPVGAKGTTVKPVPAKRVVKDLARDLDQAFAKEKQVKKKGVKEGKIKLSTDPNWYGAEVGDYQATGPVISVPANRLVGFEPDNKMDQPASKANVEKIVAGLKQGAKLPPLLVRKYKNGYQVLDGHHRFWAYKLLGTKSIPAQVVPDEDIEEKGQQGVAEVKRPAPRTRGEFVPPPNSSDSYKAGHDLGVKLAHATNMTQVAKTQMVQTQMQQQAIPADFFKGYKKGFSDVAAYIRNQQDANRIRQFAKFKSITPDQIQQIVARYSAGETSPQIAPDFGLDAQQILRLIDKQSNRDEIVQLNRQNRKGKIGPQRQLAFDETQVQEQHDWEDADEFGMSGSEFFSDDDRLRDGDYVRDRQDGESGEIFRMSGDPTERRVRILDRDGRGWYISPERLVAVDRTDPDIMRYFGRRRQRDMDEAAVKTMYRVIFNGRPIDMLFATIQQAQMVATKLQQKYGGQARVDHTVDVPKELSEKQDACYRKVKSRYKVWPSAYASGALVQCRKKGAANWGTGGKKK